MEAKYQKIQCLEELANAIRDCDQCQLRERGSKPVPGHGAKDAKVFVVGEAPNREAELQGQPFVGGIERGLARRLEYLALRREEVYVTNAVKCVLRDKRGEVRTGYGPSGEEILACRDWLLQEVRLVRPKILLTIGWAAAQSAFEAAVGKVQNQGKWLTPGGRYGFALYHFARSGVDLTDDDKKVLEELRLVLSQADC